MMNEPMRNMDEEGVSEGERKEGEKDKAGRADEGAEVVEVPAWAAQNYTNRTVTVDRRKNISYVHLPNQAITRQVKTALRPIGFDGASKRWIVANNTLPMLEMMAEEAGYKVIISEVAWKDRLESIVSKMEKVLSEARDLLNAADL